MGVLGIFDFRIKQGFGSMNGWWNMHGFRTFEPRTSLFSMKNFMFGGFGFVWFMGMVALRSVCVYLIV